MGNPKEKATPEHWEGVWQSDARLRLPYWFDVSTRNLQRLLKKHVRAGAHYLEIGCAPGRLLAWVAKKLHAEVAGLDYSATGMVAAEELFRALGLRGDLRCEDLFSNTFGPGSFDVVVSFGLIEHFDDPGPAVESHLHLVKAGGLALIVVPNYRSLYGRLQCHFDPGNLEIHNLEIMTPEALRRLMPQDLAASAEVSHIGRVAPGLVNFDKKWPTLMAKSASHFINIVGNLQPFDFAPIAPMLALKITKNA